MIVGAAAVLSAYTRQTYSIAVIMLETTQNINLFLPITITILVSSTVGNLFNKSVYQQAVHAKQIPYLTDKITVKSLDHKAGDIMSTNVVFVHTVSSVASLQ